MTDEHNERNSGIRRIGAKDRKQKLSRTGPLIPPPGAPPPELPLGDPPALMPDVALPLPPAELPEELTPSTANVPETDTATAPTPTDSHRNDLPDRALLNEEDNQAAEALNDAIGGSSTRTTDDNDLAPMEDAEALIEELDSGLVQTLSPADDDHARFRRPAAQPLPQPSSQRDKAFGPSHQPQTSTRVPTRTRPRPARSRGRNRTYNLLTLLFTAGGCGLLAYFAALWQNPYSEINPFAPFTPPPIVITATYTPSHTFTPSITPTPSRTPTPSPTATPTDPPTPTPSEPEAPVEAAPGEGFSFSLLQGRAIYLTNPEARGGCNWASIAGTVTDANNQALNGYQIRILGNGVDETIISGSAPGYGPGGFELPLGRQAIDAQFAVQLANADGIPVSTVYTITTSSICEWNIAVLRFIEQAIVEDS
ncbi:MAG: hypothetical protein SNJ59_08765 [Aggregatilineales bacterium]